MGERCCVYSVLMGGYEMLVEQPVAESSDVDFVLFTDDRGVTSESWQIRHEEPVLPQDPTRSSRRPKILPHVVLPEYDVSIYVDNRVVLRQDPQTIVDRLLPDDSVLAINAHDERETVRDEFEVVMRWGLDARWVCCEQLEHYESWRPDTLGRRPLWSGFMVRRHNDPVLIRANEIWWTQLLRYSRRDQLSFVLALAEAGLEPTIHHLPGRGSELHEWLHPSDVGRIDSRRGKLPVVPELVECQARAREQARRAAMELDEAQQRLAKAQTSVALLRESRQEVLDSMSWRLTGPLRWLADRVRGLS